MTLERIAVTVATERPRSFAPRSSTCHPSDSRRSAGPTPVTLVVYADTAVQHEILAAFPGATRKPVEPGWEDAWRALHQPVVDGWDLGRAAVVRPTSWDTRGRDRSGSRASGPARIPRRSSASS